MANLVCPRCGAICFRFMYGCEDKEPCFYPGLGRFDAEAYNHRFDGMKSSPAFELVVRAEWDRVFGA